MNPVGARIRLLRNEQKLTLPELAAKAGLSKGLLSKLENTAEPNPSLETLQKIAIALDSTLGDLLDSEVVRVKRILPDKVPDWVKGLAKDLGREPDQGILEALYVVQQRKAGNSKGSLDWLYMYRSLEMSLQKASK
jgi:transcriptional regulator with XRE-family HTH domain